MPDLAPLIALVGPDGSGKSTLLDALVTHVAQRRPTRSGYLGLGSGQSGKKIAQIPLIGARLRRVFDDKARQARDPQSTIPGLLTALVLYRYSLKRQARFDQMMAARAAGITVITDRYPQIEVPGFYDGPGLSAARADTRLIRWLAARERQLYVRMASHRPNLVLRLNIDLATAMVRKPDHELALLQQKIAVTPLLRFNAAKIIDIDATRPFDRVLNDAIKAIDAELGG
jgi:thymidylate kinase